MKGVCQSRGIGDIIIALPIARWFYDRGEEIVWPICREFLGNFEKVVPWVKWVGIETDARGDFFLNTPMKVFSEYGIKNEDVLYLYQYLNSNPELTNPELFSVMKFDQYKYWVTGVPFVNKWRLSDCIIRDYEREKSLLKSLEIDGEYVVVHRSGSNFRVDVDINWYGDDVRVIDVDEHLTDCIFDWIGVISGAKAFIGVDSSLANMVDSMGIDVEKFWIRRSPWDLTPVLGGSWRLLGSDLPIEEVKRVNIREEVEKKNRGMNSRSYSHVPFDVNKSGIPTSFLGALKGNTGYYR